MYVKAVAQITLLVATTFLLAGQGAANGPKAGTAAVRAPVAKAKAALAETKPTGPAWGSWIYLQGDKGVQYRSANVGAGGDKVVLKTQFRVEPGNKIACYSDRCEGYVMYLAVIDPDSRSTLAYHHVFFPRGTTGMWTLPETQSFTPKPTDWGRLYLDTDNAPSLAHTATPDEHTRIRIFDTSCVDDRIPGVSTRCTDYDASKAETVGM